MGRELRRVPLDFDWPLNKLWGGYVTPEELVPPACTACDYEGRGPEFYTPEAYSVAATFYPHLISWTDQEHGNRLAWRDKLGQAEVDNLVAHERCGVLVSDDSERGSTWTHPPRTAEEINAENRPGARGFGHDAINRSILVKFRCEQLGIPVYCTSCGGEGNTGTQEERDAYENWEWTEPPEGEGYQLWETTSEGSPITPVFATIEELCEYAALNCTVFASDKVTAEQWRSMLDEDFVRSEYGDNQGNRIVFI